MDNQTISSNIYGGVLLLDGPFDVHDIVKVAEEYCPLSFSGEQVAEMALSVLDELLSYGVVEVESVDEKTQKITYKSIFTLENDTSAKTTNNELGK